MSAPQKDISKYQAPKYQVMPPLSAEQYEGLKASIAEAGTILNAVDYDDAGEILDGHNRVAICAELGIVNFPKRILYHLTTPEEKRAYARNVNINRRHITKQVRDQLIVDQLKDTPRISDRALAARIGVDHKTVGAKRKQLVARGEIPHVEKLTDSLGRTQSRTKPRAPTYIDNSPEGRNAAVMHVKEIRTENMSASREQKLAKVAAIAEKGKANIGKMPRNMPVIYMDAPHKNYVRNEENGHDKSPEMHYPTMTNEEIANLFKGAETPFAENAVLFFWTTANRIDIATDIVRGYGFDFKSSMIWDKENIGTGRWVRDQHEVLFIARKGKGLPCPLPGENCPSVYREKKGKHSVKPQFFAAMIDGFYPDLPKVEFFNRRDLLPTGDIRLRTNSKWQFWGFEA